MSDENTKRRTRWRLILEAGSESVLGGTLDDVSQARARAIAFLYDREYNSQENRSRNIRPGTGVQKTAAQTGQKSQGARGNGSQSGETPSQQDSKNGEPSASGESPAESGQEDTTSSGNKPEQSERGNTQGQPEQSGGESWVPPLDRQGGLGPSQLTIPEWIDAIHELFPQKTIERLEKDALERYQLEEMVTNPDLLSRAQPSQTLLKAVLRTKHLMNQEVLAMARHLVRKVIEELLEKLAQKVKSPFLGAVDRRQRSFLKVAKNFDAETTIRRNLQHYDPKTKRLYIQKPYFFSRIRRHVERWQIIILVDESGSMLDSVIHAAVTAAIFFGLKQVRTHLCLFDTSVVDVTEECSDPVETIMKVQLGGGTDIGQALTYAASLVDNPRNTIVILITDFYEGAPVQQLLTTTKNLIESGVTLLGLAALDEQANPNYDRNIAQQMVNLGAHVAAMTPGELAQWVAQKIR
ncbi:MULTISPECIES: VWA domain-containing protein [Nostocales]|uniref:VWA domain-containing protein n=3 Tax=Nostocales TaxID=1161 RepID=A0A0C1N7Z2_9CYAN|nr:VWA domain-containing protein [Tolypothrix bouteillei]KAF3885655.1 VWA domain-containing protein [Tolypothrix bouteillei VB521301]